MSEAPEFTIVLRGYDREDVDLYVARTLGSPPGTVVAPEFTIVMRGYERTQVDAYVRAQGAGTPAPSPPPVRLSFPDFGVVLRGYDRKQVDRYVAEANRRIAELEKALQAAAGEG